MTTSITMTVTSAAPPWVGHLPCTKCVTVRFIIHITSRSDPVAQRRSRVIGPARVKIGGKAVHAITVQIVPRVILSERRRTAAHEQADTHAEYTTPIRH